MVLTLLLAIIVCTVGGNLENSTSINKIASSTNRTSSNDTKVKEVQTEQAKIEADKVIAVAKVKAEADQAASENISQTVYITKTGC